MINLHYFYYKKYFDGVDFTKVGNYDQQSKAWVERANERLTSPVRGLAYSELPSAHAVELEVLYPGLITGVGIQHEASVEGELKLGLHFDYTYGFPVVYGSSVKGMLKSYFEEVYSGSYDARKLSLDIFEGIGPDGNPKSIYDRDIFYDAVIVRPDADDRVLTIDSLAPHGGTGHDDPFANPVPISFAKIAPGVTIRFRFDLKDSKDASGAVVLSAEAKLNLFIEMLTTFGVGAKTNVGYGQLKCSDEDTLRLLREKGHALYEYAEKAYESGNYVDAADSYKRAMEYLDGNTDEYRRCCNRLADMTDRVFDGYIAEGEALMKEGQFDAAQSKFDEARTFAQNGNVYTDAKSAIYDLCMSQLTFAKAQAAVQVTEYASFAEKIANLKDLKALIQQAMKWIKNGNGFSDDDKEAVRLKVEDIKSKTKPRELNHFEKNLQQLYDLMGMI